MLHSSQKSRSRTYLLLRAGSQTRGSEYPHKRKLFSADCALVTNEQQKTRIRKDSIGE
jgi:hypothetical protein